MSDTNHQKECIICISLFTETNDTSSGTDSCNHALCTQCVRQYFTNALRESRYTNYELIQCPSPKCDKFYSSTDALQLFFTSDEAKNWWNSALSSKAYIANKVSCPYCKAVFDADFSQTKTCAFAECFECHRGLCIACQTPWHPGQIKVYDDVEALRKTLERAEMNDWCRCPRCGLVVEKIDGCSHVYCMCGTEFCYFCGKETINCSEECTDWDDETMKDFRSRMFKIS